MATVSTATIGAYAAIALGALVLAVFFRSPYIAAFAGVGILAHAMITTPLPSVTTLLFPSTSNNGVSWVNASGTPGRGLYSIFPNTDGNVAIWLTDIADASTARGYKITLQESDGDSRLYLLDGTNGNASPIELDGTASISVHYISAVTRTNELPVLQIAFAPGYLAVFFAPSQTGDASPNTSTDYTQFAKYRHLSHEPSAVEDVFATAPVIGVIGLETLVDPPNSNDTPGIVAPQWLTPNTSGIPMQFTLTAKNLSQPLDTAVFDAQNWTLSSSGTGGQIKADIVYDGAPDASAFHQKGLCIFASPTPSVPTGNVDYFVAFIFFGQMSVTPDVITPEGECRFLYNDTYKLSCEIRIQKHMFTELQKNARKLFSNYEPCHPSGLDVLDETVSRGKCEIDMNRATDQATYRYTSDCVYLDGSDMHETIGKLDSTIQGAYAAAKNEAGTSSVYASVSESALEMGFIDDAGDRKPLAAFPNPPSDVVQSLRYWGIGLIPTIGKKLESDPSTDTQLTIANVTTDF